MLVQGSSIRDHVPALFVISTENSVNQCNLNAITPGFYVLFILDYFALFLFNSYDP
jgi:hypothetical protein